MSLFRERRSGEHPAAVIPRNSELNYSYAAEPVNSDTALRLGAVWQCVNLLTNIVATTTEWSATRLDEQGTPQPTANPPLLANPDPTEKSTTAMLWRRMVLMSMLLRGNAYGKVLTSDKALRPTAIQLIHPDLVTWQQTGYMGPWATYLGGRKVERWPYGELWHLPSLYVMPGAPFGLSPIEYAKQSIGLGLASERFAAQFFGDGAHPTGVFQTDKKVDAKQAGTIKARIMAVLRGNREPLILGDGLKYQQIQVSPEESQFLNTIKANRTTIAGYFGIPATFVGGEAANSMTYQNVEQESLQLLTYAAHPWVELLEDFYNDTTPKPTTVDGDVDALLRVDARTRTEIDKTRVWTGLDSRDEVRKRDGKPPIPDGTGGEYLWPPMATKIEAVAADSGGTTPPTGDSTGVH